MLIDENKILDVAKLAQLSLPDEERKTLIVQLDNILKLMKSLDDVDTENTVALSNPHDAFLTTRPDAITEDDDSNNLQSLTTNTKDGLYLVPKVIEDS